MKLSPQHLRCSNRKLCCRLSHTDGLSQMQRLFAQHEITVQLRNYIASSGKIQKVLRARTHCWRAQLKCCVPKVVHYLQACVHLQCPDRLLVMCGVLVTCCANTEVTATLPHGSVPDSLHVKSESSVNCSGACQSKRTAVVADGMKQTTTKQLSGCYKTVSLQTVELSPQKVVLNANWWKKTPTSKWNVLCAHSALILTN